MLGNINFRKISRILTKLPLIIAKHIFLSSIILALLSVMLGALFFYKYSILAQKKQLEALEEPYLLEEDVYQSILNVWQEHEKIFQGTGSKEYENPFLEITHEEID